MSLQVTHKVIHITSEKSLKRDEIGLQADLLQKV
jgi:hypothetical protein